MKKDTRHLEACQHQAEVRQANAAERSDEERQYRTAPIVLVEVYHVPNCGTRTYMAVTPYATYLKGFMPDSVMAGREIRVVNLPPRIRITDKLRRTEEFFKTKLLGKTSAEADRLFPEPVDYNQI